MLYCCSSIYQLNPIAFTVRSIKLNVWYYRTDTFGIKTVSALSKQIWYSTYSTHTTPYYSANDCIPNKLTDAFIWKWQCYFMRSLGLAISPCRCMYEFITQQAIYTVPLPSAVQPAVAYSYQWLSSLSSLYWWYAATAFKKCMWRLVIGCQCCMCLKYWDFNWSHLWFVVCPQRRSAGNKIS